METRQVDSDNRAVIHEMPSDAARAELEAQKNARSELEGQRDARLEMGEQR